jgi:hypothetical protein
VQLHGEKGAMQKGGAELVIVGNGQPQHARWFKEDTKIDTPIFVDPELAAYAAAGLKRSVGSVLHPGALMGAFRAVAAGNMQSSTKGDPWQQGGVIVADFPDKLRYHHVSRFAGDRAPVKKVLAAVGVIG